MFRRLLFMVAVSGLLIPSLQAQSYQSSFTEVKYDRAKGPVTLHGGVEIDAATGAASMNIPLGPGIGARGLVYVPTLQGRWAPQVQGKLSQVENSGSLMFVESYSTTHSGGFTLTPGYFNWAYQFDSESSISKPQGDMLPPSVRVTNYAGPDGSSGTLPAPDMSGVPGPSDWPTTAQTSSLIQAYGFDASWTCNAGAPGSGGELVVALTHSTLAPTGSAPWIRGSESCMGTTRTPISFPTRYLIIKGDVAFEYAYSSVHYGASQPINTLGCNASVVTHAAYALVSMRNRLGDRIAFDDTATGFRATWYSNGAATGASIEFDGSHVTYYGDGPQPSYTLGGIAAAFPGNKDGSPIPPPANVVNATTWYQGYAGFKDSKVGSLADNATGETASFAYGAPNYYSADPLEALTSVTYSDRSITLTWSSYMYRNSQDWDWMGYVPNLYPTSPDHQASTGDTMLPIYAYGVTKVVDYDTTSGAPQGGLSLPAQRITKHQRVTPVPSLRTAWVWNSTAHYDLMTHPDGHQTLTCFAEPVNNTYGGPNPDPGQTVAPSQAVQLQTLAALKHAVVEVRDYVSGNDFLGTAGTTPSAPGVPYLNPPAASSARTITMYDRFDLRAANNPTGSFYSNPLPAATRTRTWQHEVGDSNGVMTTVEHLDWDVSGRAWKTKTTKAEISSVSDAASKLAALPTGTDFVSLATQGVPAVTANPNTGVSKVDALTFNAATGSWIFGQTATEQKQATADSTGYLAPSAMQVPYSAPVVTKTYDASAPILGRLSSVAQGPIQTGFTYAGAVGQREGAQMLSATVTGPGALSGQVGATFGYDNSYGRMDQITPKGGSWTLGQNGDSLGRVTSQTDANQLQTTFQWDAASRLSALQPPTTETGTSYVVDSDQRGVTITRGVQKTQLRYNVYGSPVLERRWDGSAWSHRLFGYDAAGRKTAETVWRSGQGAENQWWQGNLVQTADVLVSYTSSAECLRYDGNGNCLQWSNTPPEANYQTEAAVAAGRAITYDAYGRVTKEVDANGVTTTITYGTLSKSVTQAFGTTHFISDAAGRLTRVVDAKNQVTEYRYDPMDRIAEVKQYPSNTGAGLTAIGAGTPQVRQWAYDSLGRTVVLDQPESGVTYYTAFNVLSKPTKAVYGLPRGWRPASAEAEDASAYTVSGVRTVTTAYDPLGRVTSVQSSEGTVNQTFAYDETSRGLSKGKLTTATTGAGISRQLTYGGLNGRLSGLVRGVDGLSFAQSLGWNVDGTLANRAYPSHANPSLLGPTQTLAYDGPKGLPSGTTYNGATLASMGYDPTHWGLNGITFGNNASSFFGYDTDQVRLKTMVHTMPTGTLKSWAYQYDGASRLTTDGEDYYGYDPLGRLMSAYVQDPLNTTAGQGLQQLFDYDAFGNRAFLSTQKVTNWTAGSAPPATPATTALSGDSRDLRNYTMNGSELATMGLTNQLPSTVGGVATGSAYDALGNLVNLYRIPGNSGTQLQLAYDALGRVISMSDTARGVAEYYTYDDEGLRIKVETWQGGVVQSRRYMIYNEARQLVSEYDMVQE